MYTAGTVKMSCWEMETSSRRKHARNAPARRTGEGGGCFVLWQMSPAMWSVELVVAGCKVVAGSNGKIVWRTLPWLGSHAARGPLRPLRRIIQVKRNAKPAVKHPPLNEGVFLGKLTAVEQSRRPSG